MIFCYKITIPLCERCLEVAPIVFCHTRTLRPQIMSLSPPLPQTCSPSPEICLPNLAQFSSRLIQWLPSKHEITGANIMAKQIKLRERYLEYRLMIGRMRWEHQWQRRSWRGRRIYRRSLSRVQFPALLPFFLRKPSLMRINVLLSPIGHFSAEEQRTATRPRSQESGEKLVKAYYRVRAC